MKRTLVLEIKKSGHELAECSLFIDDRCIVHELAGPAFPSGGELLLHHVSLGFYDMLRIALNDKGSDMEEKCETCKFWKTGAHPTSDCLRHAPIGCDDIRPVFPPARYNDWCGDWEVITTEEEIS